VILEIKTTTRSTYNPLVYSVCTAYSASFVVNYNRD